MNGVNAEIAVGLIISEVLPVRHVNRGHRFRSEIHTDIANDTDDLAHTVAGQLRTLGIHVRQDGLADRVVIPKILPRQSLADYGDAWSILVVHVGERTAPK